MLNKIEDYYDDLEKEMLDEFFLFVSKHNNYNRIHWNMRDINYGFEAIPIGIVFLGVHRLISMIVINLI